MVTNWPKSKSYSLTWAIKMAATASYRAVPSMLMVAPTGSTKRAICRSTPQFSRRHFMVIGKVAELQRRRMKNMKGGFHWTVWLFLVGWENKHSSVLTWMMWPMQWREPAVALWWRRKGSCEWRRRRRVAAGWGRAQTDQTARWWSTCPASPPGGPGRACPGSFLPQGTQCRRGSTCRRENRMWQTDHLFLL